LIDYVGARRPILAITPKGTSQKLVNKMGFCAADPEDELAIKGMLTSFLKQRGEYTKPLHDGTFDAVYGAFSKESILAKFDELVKHIGNKK
jgi:hypothetical protein